MARQADMVTVAWPRDYSDRLRIPAVCIVTGQPATASVSLLFQHIAVKLLPRGLARWIVRRYNPSVRMRLPATADVARKELTGRALAIGGGCLILASLVVGAILGNAELYDIGRAVFVAMLVGGIGGWIVGKILDDPVRTRNADGWLSMKKAHPAFADAFARMNPPGVVHVSGGWRPEQGYPPQGYSPQGYPPQGYPPQGRPPQGYPPQGYPAQGYPQQPAR